MRYSYTPPHMYNTRTVRRFIIYLDLPLGPMPDAMHQIRVLQFAPIVQTYLNAWMHSYWADWETQPSA